MPALLEGIREAAGAAGSRRSSAQTWQALCWSARCGAPGSPVTWRGWTPRPGPRGTRRERCCGCSGSWTRRGPRRWAGGSPGWGFLPGWARSCSKGSTGAGRPSPRHARLSLARGTARASPLTRTFACASRCFARDPAAGTPGGGLRCARQNGSCAGQAWQDRGGQRLTRRAWGTCLRTPFPTGSPAGSGTAPGGSSPGARQQWLPRLQPPGSGGMDHGARDGRG